MPTLLGLTSERNRVDESRWRQALERMNSRSGRGAQTIENAKAHIAWHGPDLSGYAEDDSWTVMLDGFLDDFASAEEAASPSEHILRCIREKGVEALYTRTGSFALVAVDRKHSITYLMKGRFGSRPLFYAKVDGGWCWASEIKCIQPFSGAELDRQSLPEIFHYRWLAGPRTLLSAVRQVLPGHVVILGPDSSCETHCYWRARVEPRTSKTLNELVDQTGSLLLDYLRGLARRYPRVGIPLSAGVDSSLLAALAKQAGFSDCVTVSARYPGLPNPELEPAAEAAGHLKLEHLVVDVDEDFIARQFRPLLWRLEEPIRHYHVFPLSAIFEKLSSRVDLVLYGEGADTAFGLPALQRLALFAHRRSQLERIPAPVRRIVAAVARASRTGRGDYLADLLRHTPQSFLFSLFAIKSHTDPAQLIPGLDQEVSPNPEVLSRFFPADADWATQLYCLNLCTEVKCHLDTMDRIAAPSGIAVAVPFLSHGTIDLVQSIPATLKSSRGVSKPILRELGSRYYPREWMYRPKFGFDTPTDQWLRGPLRPFLDTLHEPRTLSRGIFSPEVLKSLRLENDWELLWTSVCLETLLRIFVDGDLPE